jgi:natural product biosynthesis luciferase-like monooxygenase protein
MEFGIYALPTYFPDTDGSIEAFYRHTLRFLEESERLGFDHAWVNEHHFHPFGGMIPAPAVMLAAVAARTSRIRLGTSVAVLPLHHPIEVAEAYAMVDQISGGRLDFGIGTGFLAHDHETMGVDFADRFQRMQEGVDIILRAWRERPFSYGGRFHRFEELEVWPPPVQTPHPPIWAAATRSPDTFAWIGGRGYNLLTVGYVKPLDEQAALIETYRRAAAASGHDPAALQVSTHLLTHVREDGDEARRVAAQAMERYLALSKAARSLARDTLASPLREQHAMERLVSEGRVLAGNPDECVEFLGRTRRALGLSCIDCSFYFGGIDYEDAHRSFELFAREVMPRVRASSAGGGN